MNTDRFNASTVSWKKNNSHLFVVWWDEAMVERSIRRVQNYHHYLLAIDRCHVDQCMISIARCLLSDANLRSIYRKFRNFSPPIVSLTIVEIPHQTIRLEPPKKSHSEMHLREEEKINKVKMKCYRNAYGMERRGEKENYSMEWNKCAFVSSLIAWKDRNKREKTDGKWWNAIDFCFHYCVCRSWLLPPPFSSLWYRCRLLWSPNRISNAQCV